MTAYIKVTQTNYYMLMHPNHRITHKRLLQVKPQIKTYRRIAQKLMRAKMGNSRKASNSQCWY